MPDNLLNKALRRLLIAAMLTAGAAAQPVANDRQPLADEVFKSVQVLKGISVTEFMDTMGFFSAALGLNCTGCHVYDTYHVKVPLEIYAKAPNQRKMVYHTRNGDSISVFDGQKGWLAAVDRSSASARFASGSGTRCREIRRGSLFSRWYRARLESWKIGFPVTAIDDKEMNTIQGTGAGGSRFKLYFDAKTGLLTRQLRYADRSGSDASGLLGLPRGRRCANAVQIGGRLDRRPIQYPVDGGAGERRDRCQPVRETSACRSKAKRRGAVTPAFDWCERNWRNYDETQ